MNVQDTVDDTVKAGEMTQQLGTQTALQGTLVCVVHRHTEKQNTRISKIKQFKKHLK